MSDASEDISSFQTVATYEGRFTYPSFQSIDGQIFLFFREGLDGEDTLLGRNGEDWIDAGGANDTIYGGQHADVILAGAGDDLVFGEAGTDIITTGDGHDSVNGGC